MWSLGLVSVMRRATALCARCNGLMVDSGRIASKPYSVAIVESPEHECRDQTLDDFFTSKVTDVTHSPQLKEATSLPRQVSRRQLAQVSATAEPLELRFQRIQLKSAYWAAISNVSYTQQHSSWWRMVSISEIFPDRYSRLSSANRWWRTKLRVKASATSSVWKLNFNYPMTEPSGTLQSTPIDFV